jgi:signal transduction histidine kinase
MENLMCLLSNAQKFTSEGEISIRCSLQEDEILTKSVSKSFQIPANLGFHSFRNTKYSPEDVSYRADDLEMGLQQPKPQPKLLLLEVEDTGIGISQVDRDKLFKPFMQVSSLLLNEGCCGNAVAIRRPGHPVTVVFPTSQQLLHTNII